ncbi:hypothetical protein ABH916_000138 [Peribacillus frigoritolerans]
MLGLLINDKEKMELEYLLKREMDEILFDLQDDRIDHIVKRAINEKYNILFRLFKRGEHRGGNPNVYEGEIEFIQVESVMKVKSELNSKNLLTIDLYAGIL